MADKPPDSPDKDPERQERNADLSEEDRRFLESDFAKKVLASPGFRQMLENQKRAADIAKAAIWGRKIHQQKTKEVRDEIKNAAYDPLASVSDEIEERRAIQDSTNKKIAEILEGDEAESQEPPKRKGMELRDLERQYEEQDSTTDPNNVRENHLATTNESDLSRSPTMAKFFTSAKRYRRALRAIFSYLWHPQQFLSFMGALISLGALVMTTGFYTAKEIFYLVVIGALAAKTIHDHWQHERKKEIIALLICASVLVFSGLLSWTEWQRHSERSAQATRTDRPLLTPGLHPTPPVPELHGLRIPGNEPLWKNRCTTPERSPYDWMQLDIGSNIAMTYRELSVIRVNGEELITIAKSPAGIAVSARIISIDNSLVGQVSNNELFLNPGNRFRVVHKDWHTLEIRDNNDAEILYVYFPNRANVVIRGRFYGTPPVVVTKDKIMIGGITMMLGCYRQDGAILDIAGS